MDGFVLADRCSHLAKRRVEKLEERIDGIVTLLKASKDPATQTIGISPQLTLSTPTISHTSFEAPRHSSQPIASDPHTSEDAENWDERLFRGGTIRQRFALMGSHNPSIDQPTVSPQPSFNLVGFDLGVDDPEMLPRIFKDEINPNSRSLVSQSLSALGRCAGISHHFSLR